MNNMELLFTSSSKLTKKQARRKKKLVRLIIGFILVTLQLIFTGLFVYSVFKANIIPARYLIIGMCFLGLVSIYNILSQFTKAHAVGKVLAVILCIVCFAGNYYVSGYNNMIDNVVEGGQQKSDIMSIVALKDSSFNSLEDAKNASFGYIKDRDVSLTQTTIAAINSKFSATINTMTYVDETKLINGLYNQHCDVIILNEAYRAIILESFPDFEEKTKVIYKHEIKTTVVTNEPETPVNIETDTFAVFISGNDMPGSLAANGHSDVNIIALISPSNRQILLISTPRDAYVNLRNNDGKVGMDKLTHSGNFGIDSTIWSIEDIYSGLDIDYYAKINFTGVVTLVNALGGVTVNSEVEFTTHPFTSKTPYHFVVGPNNCDGDKALAFCRERMNVALGDVQRGRNQMLMIEAMVNKAMSPTLLARYSEIMSSISQFFVTNMPQSTISDLVRSVLDDPTPWDIQIFNVACTTPTSYYPSTFWDIPGGMSVVLLDDEAVTQAIYLIDRMENGEKINVEKYLQEEANRKQQESENASKGHGAQESSSGSRTN